jgi:hypothetical protein
VSRPPALASRCLHRVHSHKTVGVRRLSGLKRVHASTVGRWRLQVERCLRQPSLHGVRWQRRHCLALQDRPRTGIPGRRFSCGLNAVAGHPAPWPSVTAPRSPRSGMRDNLQHSTRVSTAPCCSNGGGMADVRPHPHDVMVHAVLSDVAEAMVLQRVMCPPPLMPCAV